MNFTVQCIVVQAGTQTVHAHRAFLAAFSDYFCALLGSGLNESTQNEVTLHEVDGDSFVQIIEFAYSGHITISSATVHPLLETANYIGVDQVTRACCTYLADRLTVDNVLPLLVKADELSLQSLFDKVKSFLFAELQLAFSLRTDQT